MNNPTPYRSPVPLYVPTLTVTLALLVIFSFGVKEQTRLVNTSIENAIAQREEIANIEAEAMEADLNGAEISIQRFSRDLEVNLEPVEQIDQATFDILFQKMPDGSTRSNRKLFDPHTEAGVWIPNYVSIGEREREFFVRAKKMTDLFGRGAEGGVFADTWIYPAVGGAVIYWPDQGEYVFQAGAAYDYRPTDWVALATPSQNPNRHSYWTKLILDPTPRIWMVSVVAPLYWRGEWFGAVGHDVPLSKLLERTMLLRQQEGSHFILITAENVVAGSDIYAEHIQASNGELRLAELTDPLWKQAADEARQQDVANQHHVRVTLPGHVAFVSYINSQGWLLINIIPLAPITSRIDNSFVNLRNIALGALLLELTIATSVLAWGQYRNRQYIENLNAVQQELRESEQHFRTLVSNIPGIVYRSAIDDNWTKIYLGGGVVDVIGYPAEDFKHNQLRSFASVIHPDDRPKISIAVQEALRQRQPYVLEYRLITFNGGTRWVLDRGRGIYDNNDMPLYLEGVILDATQLKDAEQQLRELNASLEEIVERRTRELQVANQELESFSYSVSHDLRSPLRAIAGYSRMLQGSVENMNADAQNLLARIQEAAREMSDLIEGLLALSRLGRQALRLQPVSPEDILSMAQGIAEGLQVNAPERSVEWKFGQFPACEADPTLLRQVFANLFGNAFKYTQGRQPAVIEIGFADGVFFVKDNGVGFNMLYSDKLFGVFQRLHSVDAFEGTGIGLAIVKRIIEKHGGHVWAAAEVDRGASFYFTLGWSEPGI